MGFPAKADFPASVWDGSSASRNSTSDPIEPVLEVYRSPNPDDYSSITAEVIAIETALVGAGFGNSSVLAVGATAGFGLIPAVNGVPTGVPASVPVGYLAWAYDKTDNKIYVYNGGWKATVALS